MNPKIIPCPDGAFYAFYLLPCTAVSDTNMLQTMSDKANLKDGDILTNGVALKILKQIKIKSAVLYGKRP